MNSYDLFDTLTAAPDPAIPAGDQDRHFPIAENIAKVRPQDVVVSDFYDTPKATRILRDVCGLNNKLICTENGKETGAVWNTVRPDHHTGDNPRTDIASAERAGIPATLTRSLPFRFGRNLSDKSGKCPRSGGPKSE